MLIRIDPSTGVPLWQQIVQQVTRQGLSGSLAAGERLPTVRELASELRINPNTVARAYQELEREGVVETKRGLGTFATGSAPKSARVDSKRLIAARVDALLVEAAQLQIASSEVLDILEERTRALPAAQIKQEAKEYEQFTEYGQS